MQLRLSLPAIALLASMNANAEDFVSIQFLQYQEDDNRVSVSAPSIMVNKDIGTDYTVNASFTFDAVSGASPTFYVADSISSASATSADASSGASAYDRGKNVPSNRVKYGNISFEEKRVAGGATITKRFANRDELTIGGNFSSEHDFESASGSAEYMHWLGSSKNSAFSLGGSFQSNEITAYCIDDVNCDASSGASQERSSTAINVQMSFMQNLNMNSYVKASIFYVGDTGYLTDSYLNVVRNNNGTTADVVGENRPDQRTAYGASLRYANALSDRTTLQLGYRYYQDDWQIDSHTLDADLYYDLNTLWRFNIGARGYLQSAAYFYSGSDHFFTDEQYASSDYRLSDFSSTTYKGGVRYAVTKAFSINLDASRYIQTTGLKATSLIAGLRYNF